MPWKHSFVHNEQTIILEFDGTLNPVESVAAIDFAAEWLKQQRGAAVLMDRSRISGIVPISQVDVFQTHERMATKYPPGTRVAILAGAVNPPAKDVKFADLVSSNRGLNCRRFQSREEALAWLAAVGGAGGNPVETT